MVEQLPLIPLPPSRRGEWVAGFVLHGEPQRSAWHPVVIVGHAAMRPDDAWRDYRDAMSEALSWWAQRNDPVWFPVLCKVTAVFTRPQSRRKTYTIGGVERPYPYPWTDGRVGFVGTPDADQIQKAAVDVCVRAGILVNDTIVQPDGTERWYAAVGEQPRTEVRFWRGV